MEVVCFLEVVVLLARVNGGLFDVGEGKTGDGFFHDLW